MPVLAPRYLIRPDVASRALRGLHDAVMVAASAAVWLGAQPHGVVVELRRAAQTLTERWRDGAGAWKTRQQIQQGR